jgi:hypothetical protein
VNIRYSSVKRCEKLLQKITVAAAQVLINVEYIMHILSMATEIIRAISQ